MNERILKIGDKVKVKKTGEIGKVFAIQEIAMIAFKRNENEPATGMNRIEKKYDVVELEKI
ncbi:unnamed protein product [marine sediment metagenome]|uniref:Uncharacterized protein n=1 Tax=marine sediment metagenome TaxID=412755 RepID=X1PU09_9ZZZZ